MNQQIKEEISREEISKGYKESKYGVIPEIWNVRRLNSVAKIIDGDRSSNYPKENDIVEDGILFLSSSNIDGSRLDLRECKYIAKEKFGTFKKGKLMQNDLVIKMRGSRTGNITQFVSEVHKTGLINAQMAIIRPDKIQSDFLFVALNSALFQRQIDDISSGSAQPQLTKRDLERLYIIEPTKEEQQKIASIIFTWDKAIELKGKLIKEKNERKKGLMQKLLTGKLKMPGFDKEWQKVKLENLIKEVNEKSIENNQHQVLSVTKHGIVPQNKHFRKQIASENNIGYKVIKKNNLVFSTMNLWMGSLDVLTSYDIGIVSPAYKVFEFYLDRIYPAFAKYFMQSEQMIWLYNVNSEQGASIVRRNLDLKGLLSTSVKIPSINEQKEIANLLLISDKEINILQKEIEELNQQKKGLMYLLLTGKFRVRA